MKDIQVYEKEQVESDLVAVKSRREMIEADPVKYAQERVYHLSARLATRKPKSATTPEHISMYDHLSNLKKEYEYCVKAKSLTGRVALEVQKLTTLEANCQKKINEFEKVR